MSSYNRHDISQTRDYIRLSAKSYLHRVLKNHGWEMPNKHESLSTAKPKSPLTDEECKVLYSVVPGPKEGTKEHATLAHTAGYGYHNLLGKLLRACVLCRLDISFAITALAKFSIHSAPEHCQAQKRLAICLRRTIDPAPAHHQALKCLAIYLGCAIDWGILYWRPSPVNALPSIPIELDIPHRTLPPVPFPSSYLEPGTHTDASLGNVPLKMASTSRCATTMASGAIAYCSKTQPITAQNISEAEFLLATLLARQ
jgi:hypothetical protein